MSINKPLTEGERKFCEYQYGMSGSFYDALISAIMRADSTNREKLAMAYPEIVDAVTAFQYVAGYWQDLDERWKQSQNLSPL